MQNWNGVAYRAASFTGASSRPLDGQTAIRTAGDDDTG